MVTREFLEKCKAVDLKTVDPATLRDLGDVVIDQSLDVEERLLSFIEQIGNPYCYTCDGLVVKVSFADQCSLEEALVHYVALQSMGGIEDGSTA